MSRHATRRLEMATAPTVRRVLKITLPEATRDVEMGRDLTKLETTRQGITRPETIRPEARREIAKRETVHKRRTKAPSPPSKSGRLKSRQDRRNRQSRRSPNRNVRAIARHRAPLLRTHREEWQLLFSHRIKPVRSLRTPHSVPKINPLKFRNLCYYVLSFTDP